MLVKSRSEFFYENCIPIERQLFRGELILPCDTSQGLFGMLLERTCEVTVDTTSNYDIVVATERED